jgi:hypothetical protein
VHSPILTPRNIDEHRVRLTGGGSSRPTRIAVVTIYVALTGLVLAACANAPRQGVAQLGVTTTSNGSGTGSTGKYAAWLAYSGCMRSNGVPTFPDPVQIDGSVRVPGSPAGVDPNTAAFTSALQTCRRLEPNGGQPTNAEQQKASDRMLKLSKCMRKHGVGAFPDPTFAAPSNRGDYSDIFSNDGVWLAIPNSVDVHSPAFTSSSVACDFGGSQ